MEKINLLIVDDHQLIREGILKMFDDVTDIHITGTAADGNEAYEKINCLEPDVVLIDISMPGLFGDQVVRMVKNERDDIKFLVMTVYDSDLYIYKSFNAGAEGFIAKDAGKEEILEAIYKIAAGGRFCSKYETGEKLDEFLDGFENRTFANQNYETLFLTTREKEVILKLQEGKDTALIADEMFISRKTVNTHQMNIYGKLGVKNLQELFALINRDEKIKRMLRE